MALDPAETYRAQFTTPAAIATRLKLLESSNRLEPEFPFTVISFPDELLGAQLGPLSNPKPQPQEAA